MNKKIGELKVNKLTIHNKLIETLENAGFILVLDFETTSEKYYIIARKGE